MWMQWESEEQDEQSYQVIDLGSRQGSDCHTHTHSVECVGDWGRCKVLPVCFETFSEYIRLAHVKKHTGPPHAVLRTMEN